MEQTRLSVKSSEDSESLANDYIKTFVAKRSNAKKKLRTNKKVSKEDCLRIVKLRFGSEDVNAKIMMTFPQIEKETGFQLHTCYHAVERFK
jgi:hypothetical protein